VGARPAERAGGGDTGQGPNRNPKPDPNPNRTPNPDQVAAMQAKGAIVPLAYGSRQEALVFRQEFMQIQVQTQP